MFKKSPGKKAKAAAARPGASASGVGSSAALAPVTMDRLSVDFAHSNRERLLSDWQWLIGGSLLPIMLTAAGDAFVQDVSTREVFFLDVVEGHVERVAADPDEFKALLEDKEFVAQHFSVVLLTPLLAVGATLPAGKVYSFKKPLVLGGEFSSENLEAADIEVHFSVAGQIWEQVRASGGLATGTVSLQ